MNRTSFFLNFVFCECFARDLRSKSLQKRAREEAACGSFIKEFSAHLFDVAQKATPERITRLTDFTSKSKNQPKKVHFFLERGPGGGSLPAAWVLKIDGF